MTAYEVVRAAIPRASESICDHVLWGMTPFPAGRVTARDIYRAANRLHRAVNAGRRLCDFCPREVIDDGWTCARCTAALTAAGIE